MHGSLKGRARWSRRRGQWLSLVSNCALALVGAGCAAFGPGTPPDDEPVDPGVAREIEEADIVKLIDGYFYLSNPYTGLRIIDARDMDAPVLAGRRALGGRGVELYVVGDHALVFTAADFAYCAGEPIDFDDPQFGNALDPGYSGSRLWAVNVADKSNPTLTATINFDGFIAGTRRVGEFLYAAGTVGSSTFVVSVDITNPGAPAVVHSMRFTGDADDIHVAQNAIYLFGDDSSLSETTLVTYVDIADTNGMIARRDSFRVPGHVRNRYYLDAYEDTLRIVTEEFRTDTFTQIVALYAYDVSDPDDITRRARLPIVIDESLRSVRFDGTRGYAVTFFQVDPLFVLDLSDPDAPQIAGELTVPGFSTHLVPLGDRLIGVGFTPDDGWVPAVSLYDVSDPAQPRQLARVTIRGLADSFVGSEATVDEKALGVLPDAGLVLLPYAHFDRATGDYADGLQLISMTRDNLILRGQVAHEGIVRRSGVHGGRLWLLSDLAYATIDVANLNMPVPLAELELISEQELLDAGLLACVDSARSSGVPLFWGGGFCGAPFAGPFLITLTSLTAVRLIRRRRVAHPSARPQSMRRATHLAGRRQARLTRRTRA